MSENISIAQAHDLCERIKSFGVDKFEVARDLLDALKMCLECDEEYAIDEAKSAYEHINSRIWELTSNEDYKSGTKWYELKKKYAYFLSHYSFDHYMQYLEWNREPKKKFWLPRRKQLMPVCQGLQDLKDRKIRFLGVSLPPRVGKSTICIFFLSWIMGLYPDDSNVMSGHARTLTDGFFKELLDIINNTAEYTWSEIFPEVKIQSTSALDTTINLNKYKRFATMTCRSMEGTLTGAVQITANGVLYNDDLVRDDEVANSMERLESLFQKYCDTLLDRKLDGAAELMVGTRWNVFDPLGRIQEKHMDDPEYRFIVIPALDENGESNFKYDCAVGFSTKYYEDMRDTISDSSWCAKYMGSPYIREGILFPRTKLNWWNGTLPDSQPDKIIATVDVAWGGGDYLAMPIIYVYGSEWYMVDCVYNDGNKDITRPIVLGKLMHHRPQNVQFEANVGGEGYAEWIDEKLRDRNIRINISAKRANVKMSKIERIVQYAPEISKIHFIDKAHASVEYNKFMDSLCIFSSTGKNTHDDAPDSLAGAMELLTCSYGIIHTYKRPF